jgi:hypothetical protein
MRSHDYFAVNDAIDNAIDTILVMPDPAVRLAAFTYLRQQVLTRITRERNKAAYEARADYSGLDLADIAGCKPHDVYRWANLYAVENRLPALGRIYRTDVSHAVVLAHNAGVYRDRTGANE